MVFGLFRSRNDKRREFLDGYFAESLHQFYADTCLILLPGNYLIHPPCLMEIASYLYACSMETYDEYKPRKAKVKFAGIKYDFESVLIALEIWDEHFNGAIGHDFLHGFDGGRKVSGTAVW